MDSRGIGYFGNNTKIGSGWSWVETGKECHGINTKKLKTDKRSSTNLKKKFCRPIVYLFV